jgi:uncharacterized protein YeaO (DUF488 family)
VAARKPRVTIARVYDDVAASSGHRVLVDRLWPRGVTKAAAPIDEWCKDVAPSPQLRKWYSHDPARFPEFGERYRVELAAAERAAQVDRLGELSRTSGLVLVTAVRDVSESSAAILAGVLLNAAS